MQPHLFKAGLDAVSPHSSLKPTFIYHLKNLHIFRVTGLIGAKQVINLPFYGKKMFHASNKYISELIQFIITLHHENSTGFVCK
jgi:hypothetical protein